jgi:hypothetical protein
MLDTNRFNLRNETAKAARLGEKSADLVVKVGEGLVKGFITASALLALMGYVNDPSNSQIEATGKGVEDVTGSEFVGNVAVASYELGATARDVVQDKSKKIDTD